MYDKILVSHAGTIEGDLALKHAIHIAKLASSEIILLHVIEDFPHIPIMAIHSSQAAKIKKDMADVAKEMKSVMEKEMEKRVETCTKNGVKSYSKIETGSAAEEILRIVKSQKINLIVMAKRRKLKGLKSLLALGSVSRKIIENTSCPVLLIDVEKK